MVGNGLEGFKVLEPTKIVGDLVAFISDELPFFSKSQEFVDILEMKKNENQHSLSFCVYMTNQCNSKYYFARENAQKGSSVIDIGVYKGSILIFTIEAKLLPTPLGSSKIERFEHEYVFGKGAGIQRFKDGKHGRNNANTLLYENGIIGFVKESSFDFWFLKVNQWITNVQWDKSELLEKIYFSSIGRLQSKHQRQDDEVVLHHFWVDVSNNT